MPASPSPAPPSPARSGGTVLLPAARFFVRRIPLVAGQDAVAQVELALETIGPFTPGQLYYGYCPSRDGTQALVFAAYRKSFAAAEVAEWSRAHAVLPDFAVWLGQATGVPAGLWVHEHPAALTVLVWDQAGELPAGLLAHETTAETRDKVQHELVQEALHRFGGGSGAPRVLTAATVAGIPGKEGLLLKAGDRSALLSPAQLRAMDVRDKVEFAGQIIRQKRDRLLWLAFVGAVAGLAACVVVELGLQISHLVIAHQRRGLETNAGAVRQIEQANLLAVRMESLAGQSLRPFEMLAVLNNARPATLEFLRAQTAGPRQMEIEAQSGNAADPQEYEKALRRLSGVEKAELRDFRTSGGKTTFLVAVTFKPGFGGTGGAR